MVAIRYYVAMMQGKPPSMVARLARAIRHLDLSSSILLLKVGRDAAVGRGRRAQFYVAIGTEGESALAALDRIKREVRFTLLDENRPLAPEQAQALAFFSQNVDTLAIHRLGEFYERTHRLPRSLDPFASDSGEYPVIGSAAQGALQPADGIRPLDRLLAWMSAAGSGSTEALLKTCRVLELARERDQVARYVRRMTRLGHVEWSRGARTWRVCPPTLVQCADDARSFLAGQRTAGLLAALRPWMLSETAQRGAPSLVHIASEARDALQGENPRCIWRFAGRAGPKLGAVLPDRSGFRASLRVREHVDAARFAIERWDRGSFRPTGAALTPGLYRLSHREGRGSPRSTLYFDGRGRWLEGPWNDLHYLWRSDLGNLPPAVLTRAGGVLLRFDGRWPNLYERALILCSGALPTRRGRYLLHSCVPRELARSMCEKLAVVPEEADA